jgi:LPXTG-motif cell wall-anchored protein
MINLSFASLSVNLDSQNPDPVAPGNFVYVNLKLSNSEKYNLNDVMVEFIEDSYIKASSKDEKIKDIGLVPAYSSDGGNFVIAKFKLYVTPKAPIGENTIKFKLTSSDISSFYEYKFNILVEDKNPNLEIKDLNSDVISPGESGKFSFKILNSNPIPFKDVIVKLGVDEISDNAISVNGGVNQIKITNLDGNSEKEITFDVFVNPNAEIKSYNIPIYIDYEDSLGNLFSEKYFGSLKVYLEPTFSFNLESQEIYSKGSGKINFAIANPSRASLKGVEVKVLDGDNYKVLDGGYEYIGDLNPDDFQTIQWEFLILDNKPTSIKLKVDFFDSYNKKFEKELNIPLKVYSEEELKSYGLSKTSSNNSNYIIFIIIILVLGFYFYKRKKKSNKK